MKKLRCYKILYFAAVLVLSFVLFGDSPENFEKGEIIDRVVCKAETGQSYALYLPTAYSAEGKWPILFAFDAAARTKITLELFKNVAEKYHYIIVCSHNARNGPWKNIIEAMRALWRDTRQRLAIDYDRIYTTGFSGGARAAALFPHVVGISAAGIIACGAGLPSNVKADQVKPSFYYGIVGLEDFNYKEFARLGGELKQAGVQYFVDVIDGPHSWPPEEICTRAIEWMEVDAQKKGTREKDDGLIAGIYKRSADVGQRLEDSGKIYYSAAYCRAAASLFKGLTDTSALEKQAARLEGSKEFSDFLEEEGKRNNKELGLLSRFNYVFSSIRNTNPGGLKLKDLLRDLQLNELLKDANRQDNIFDSAMAKRLLPELVMKGNEEASKFIEKGDYKRAFFFLEIASRADDTDPIAFYNLACYYSLNNNKKEALKYLETAMQLALKKGYKNFSYLETDKQLDPLRKEGKFLEILRFVKQEK